ncbi:Antitoxin VapB [Bordetella ansorpii]|uniref:Antitoxin VapB n=1 Tax=Bordetella ansorpii TaxID=288768 RepID=A0A157S894_9BORD|nr:type II toxin-antitoxin system VapB family antitoxin [Bordetella ansorpii]SAI20615.1 Antitoxin VapB [Bordetella ansorpii]SAI66136.1 Antitoxin VapB [Bordetella ansorpii]
MNTGSIFTNNRTQAVRLPAETRFPDHVKRVEVRVVGHERVLTPLDSAWDSFFLGGASVTDDFMQTRASQEQPAREPF